PFGEPSAEQHLNDEGRYQKQDDAPSHHSNWKFMRRRSSCVEKINVKMRVASGPQGVSTGLRLLLAFSQVNE
ncbi:MAG: hypothetical protein WAN18_02055, partial [Candidatus Sulfotelmatobacter sp.]